MKIIITEEQFYNLIPPSVKRRMTNKDFEILDGIIDNNKIYFITQSFGEYLDGTLHDSLNEFIREYKVEEIDPNLDNDDWDNEEDIIYNIFWQLIPFLKKKYHDVFYDYYMGYHRRRGNVNESKENLYNFIPSEIKRRMTERDLGILYDIIDKNKRFDLNNPFDKYLDINLRDSLGEFIAEYALAKIDPNLDDDEWTSEENKIYKIFWELMPFLKKKYYDDLYDYYMEYHGRSGNINESQDERLFGELPNSIKRRLEPGDFDDLELIIDSKYKLRGYYLSGNFENYLNSVISDSIDTFVVNYKFPRYENGDFDDYQAGRRKAIFLFQGLIPFLKEKYRDKLYEFYSNQ